MNAGKEGVSGSAETAMPRSDCGPPVSVRGRGAERWRQSHVPPLRGGRRSRCLRCPTGGTVAVPPSVNSRSAVCSAVLLLAASQRQQHHRRGTSLIQGFRTESSFPMPWRSTEVSVGISLADTPFHAAQVPFDNLGCSTIVTADLRSDTPGTRRAQPCNGHCTPGRLEHRSSRCLRARGGKVPLSPATRLSPEGWRWITVAQHRSEPPPPR